MAHAHYVRNPSAGRANRFIARLLASNPNRAGLAHPTIRNKEHPTRSTLVGVCVVPKGPPCTRAFGSEVGRGVGVQARSVRPRRQNQWGANVVVACVPVVSTRVGVRPTRFDPDAWENDQVARSKHRAHPNEVRVVAHDHYVSHRVLSLSRTGPSFVGVPTGPQAAPSCGSVGNSLESLRAGTCFALTAGGGWSSFARPPPLGFFRT